MRDSYIKKIDEPYRTEIQRRIDAGFDFDSLVDTFSKKRYQLQPFGVMFRQPFIEIPEHKEPDSTILDIIFCRKSDIHKHTKVGEVIRTLGGEGTFYFSTDKKYNRPTQMNKMDLGLTTTIYVPPMIPHAFVPKKNTYLEISLTTLGGKLEDNGDKEIILKPFNKWAVDY